MDQIYDTHLQRQCSRQARAEVFNQANRQFGPVHWDRRRGSEVNAASNNLIQISSFTNSWRLLALASARQGRQGPITYPFRSQSYSRTEVRSEVSPCSPSFVSCSRPISPAHKIATHCECGRSTVPRSISKSAKYAIFGFPSGGPAQVPRHTLTWPTGL